MKAAEKNYFVGYVCAVIVASLTFVLISTTAGLLDGALSTVHPLSERASQMLIMACLMFAIIAFVAFFTAAIPVYIAQKVSERFSIEACWFFVICGALTGLLLSPVAIAIVPNMGSNPPETPPLLLKALSFSYFSVPSGIIGGFAYWFSVHRPKSRVRKPVQS